MTTVDAVTEAARAWLDGRLVLPNRPIVIFEGQYDDGTRVAVGFHPDTFLDGRQVATLVYRLDRSGRMATAPVTPEFVMDQGFAIPHWRTMRLLAAH
jgi:hypothetical protein